MVVEARSLVIGIFGLGTVGGGVVELLKGDPRFQFRKAFVRFPDKPRENVPPQLKFVSHPDEILDDNEINCIVEVMGGTTVAWDVVQKGIQNDKHVVTANKALISLYMDQITALLEAHPKVQFYYEAAVCGGIPIINIMKRSLAPDRIARVVGIMNGTTNYMLSEMSDKGIDYQSALESAQRLGYAEADPRADVEGWDARSKLCILAKLAFGVSIDESKVFCQGISQITAFDFEYGRLVNRTIKLLGVAEAINKENVNQDNVKLQNSDHEKLNGISAKSTSNETSSSHQIALSVSPVMVPILNPLAHVTGAINAVQIDSRYLERSLYVGPGAGRFPTANSVVSDLLELVVQPVRTSPPFRMTTTVSDEFSSIALDYKAEFYVRFTVVDRVGVIFKISEIFMLHNVPIFSILQTPIKDKNRVPFAIITESCFLSDMDAVCREVKERRSSDLDFILEPPLCLRYFSDETENPKKL